MSEQIFREKSIKRISSPEELNKYLKVTNPGVWVLLSAIIVFLVGLIVWASVGTLETRTDGIADADDGIITVIVTGDKADVIEDGMTVYIDETDTDSVLDDVHIDEYGRAVGTAVMNVPDGKYRAEIVIESIKPMSFLIKDRD